MSTRSGRLSVVVCVAFGCALGAIGCLNGDDTAAPGALGDAGGLGAPDTSINPSDATGGNVDGAGPDGATNDAQPDAPPPVDAGQDAAPIDAGVDAAPGDGGITGPSGLVAAGSLSKSTRFTLNGTVGPATAPVLRSPKYQLVGGMAVTTQRK